MSWFTKLTGIQELISTNMLILNEQQRMSALLSKVLVEFAEQVKKLEEKQSTMPTYKG